MDDQQLLLPENQGNGFTQTENGGEFPNASPLWGFNPYAQLPDVIERNYADDPDSHSFAIVPDDAKDLPSQISQLYVGQSGDVHFTTEFGEDITMASMAEGVNYPFTFKIVRVFATGTTADKLVGIS